MSTIPPGFRPSSYVNLSQDGGILNDHIIGRTDAAANPDWTITDPAESHDRLPAPLTAAAQIWERLPEFTVLQSSYGHELRQHQ
jgi:hypothetical protein